MANLIMALLLVVVSFKGGVDATLLAQTGAKADPVSVSTEPSLFNWAQLGAMGTISALLVWQITVSNPAQSKMVLESQEKREKAILEADAKKTEEIRRDRHESNEKLQTMNSNFYIQLERHREESAKQMQLERETAERHFDRLTVALEKSYASVSSGLASVSNALSSLEKSHNLLADAIRQIGKDH